MNSEEEETELEGLDWWSKYHASKQASNQDSDSHPAKFNQSNSLNFAAKLSPHTLPKNVDNNTGSRKADTETLKRGHVSTKLTSAASSLVSKLSPKSQRKQDELEPNVAKLKVRFMEFLLFFFLFCCICMLSIVKAECVFL